MFWTYYGVISNDFQELAMYLTLINVYIVHILIQYNDKIHHKLLYVYKLLCLHKEYSENIKWYNTVINYIHNPLYL